jgi:hypothetical protein
VLAIRRIFLVETVNPSPLGAFTWNANSRDEDRVASMNYRYPVPDFG